MIFCNWCEYAMPLVSGGRGGGRGQKQPKVLVQKGLNHFTPFWLETNLSFFLPTKIGQERERNKIKNQNKFSHRSRAPSIKYMRGRKASKCQHYIFVIFPSIFLTKYNGFDISEQTVSATTIRTKVFPKKQKRVVNILIKWANFEFTFL